MSRSSDVAEILEVGQRELTDLLGREFLEQEVLDDDIVRAEVKGPPEGVDGDEPQHRLDVAERDRVVAGEQVVEGEITEYRQVAELQLAVLTTIGDRQAVDDQAELVLDRPAIELQRGRPVCGSSRASSRSMIDTSGTPRSTRPRPRASQSVSSVPRGGRRE